MLTKISLVIIICAVSISNAALLSQYDFEETWANSVSAALDASPRNGATLEQDAVRGWCANLSTTKWAYVGYDGNLVFDTQMSLAVWVRSTSSNWTSNNRIMGRGYAWAIQVQGSATAAFTALGESAPLVGTMPINDGYWHHIAVTWDITTGERKLYVDGILDAQDSFSPTAISNYDRFAIAARATGTYDESNVYQGYVDDVRVYDSVLTAQEISDIVTPPDPCVENPAMDLNGDCVVDLLDFIIFADDWFVCGYWDQADCP
jgi:hypothetical protein